MTDVHTRSNTSFATLSRSAFSTVLLRSRLGFRSDLNVAHVASSFSYSLLVSPAHLPPFPSLSLPQSPPSVSPSVPPSFPSYVLNSCDVAAHPVLYFGLVGDREFRRSGRKYIGADSHVVGVPHYKRRMAQRGQTIGGDVHIYINKKEGGEFSAQKWEFSMKCQGGRAATVI